MTYNRDLVVRQCLAVNQAAEMWLTEWDLAYNNGQWENPALQAAYDMAIAILSAILDLDAEPAKARLDRVITEMYHDQWHQRMPPPVRRSMADLDSAFFSGADATLRSM